MKLYTLDNQLIKETRDRKEIIGCFTGIVEIDGGSKYWYKNGLLHREDGPAIIRYDSTKEYLIHGKYHRLDGPAIECVDGSKQWYINNKKCTKKQHKFLTDLLKLKGLL